RLVRSLKAFDSAPVADTLPHDELIAETDRLLAAAGACAPLEFTVDGEWTAEEIAQGRGGGRRTPMTPVALPLPTPVSAPLARRRSLPAVGTRLLYGLAPLVAAVAAFLYVGGDFYASRWLLGAAERLMAVPAGQLRASGEAAAIAASRE